MEPVPGTPFGSQGDCRQAPGEYRECGHALYSRPDQAYTPAHPDRPQRLPERSRSTDFDHMVDAGAAGQFEHALMTVRRSFVIDHIGGAEFSQPFELAIAALSRDHPCAVHACKL